VEAISFVGASPVFVDVDARTHTLDPGRLEAAITTRTKAVIPVHLYGQTADMDPIMEIARRHGIEVIEDACQAHGAEYKGKKAGTIGRIGCFSCYPGKNLGAYGEAGIVLTADPEIAETITWLRNHGQRNRHDHCCIGWNARMDGFQGAVLSVKLPYLNDWNESRRRIAGRYRELLADVPGLELPYEASWGKHIYHIFAVHTSDPLHVMRKLQDRAIGAARHYPVPIHLQEAYRWMGLGAGSFPNAERNAREELSLPIYPELTDEQIAYVADRIRHAVSPPVFAGRV
jgi:dTDP-4-amino-4,6-dideoxygalactose transaminase